MNCYQIISNRHDVKWFSAIAHLSKISPIYCIYRHSMFVYLGGFGEWVVALVRVRDGGRDVVFVSVKCPADRQHGLEGKQHSHDFEMSHDNGPVDTSTGESPSSAAFSRL